MKCSLTVVFYRIAWLSRTNLTPTPMPAAGGPTEDEFLDVIYWLRQIIAVILGVIWGVAPLKGFLGIAIFCIINAGVLYVYFSSFQQIDEEEYGGTWELTKEGFMTSFALFLVVWIIFYTALHFD
uniref:RAB5 interacting factor n=1 Tax=Amphiprion ocellaris TaxID=80972 RepID=A0AAQ5XEK8_AMPOC